MNELHDLNFYIKQLLKAKYDFAFYSLMGSCDLNLVIDTKQNEKVIETFIVSPFNPKEKTLSIQAKVKISGNFDLVTKKLKHLIDLLNIDLKSPDDCEIQNSKILKSCQELNATAYATYQKAFKTFHDNLRAHKFSKLVLSRPYYCPLSKDLSLSFLNLTKAYPGAFCYLAKIEDNGIFMGASPEILGIVEGNNLSTMSLAGTMPCSNDDTYKWSLKNQREQNIVSLFIKEKLSPLCRKISLSNPITHKAGPVVHLLTKIEGILSPDINKYDAVTKLHPTPAVCGLPSEKALDFILNNEGYKRNFYAGFVGFINKDCIKLFVNLRCLTYKDAIATLYAGGGILEESILEDEWAETENKLKTLKDFI